MNFSALALSPPSLQVLQELGFESMTAIQEQAIPLLLEGRDLIGQSKTGSGKTLAFSLPLLEKINLNNRNIQGLVLCPTRELCTQVAREIRRLGRARPELKVLIASGGQPLGPQLESLQQGVHLIVATPGRLVDLIQRARPDWEDLQMLILDEADRMLEMGFQDDLNLIFGELPRTRQTALFSATYPDTIKSLSRAIQLDPLKIQISEPEGAQKQIEQYYLPAEVTEKKLLLMRLLRRLAPSSALIFCNLKTTTREISQNLQQEGFSAEALNGDLEQKDRDEVLAQFRNGSFRFLIATDVAARGLDVENLPLVINYELPHEVDTYIHRIGRTGRAGQDGLAISLASAAEKAFLIQLQLNAKIILEKGALPPKSDMGDLPLPAAMQTISIGGGRKDKIRPGDLLGALTGDLAGLEAKDVGKIEIFDHFSYVAIARQKAERVYRKLKDGRIKGKRFSVRLLS